MAPHSQLPCDIDGVCMICKKKPSAEENIPCKTCATPWHLDCLSLRPQTLADTLLWDCPDCDDSLVADHPPSAPIISGGGGGGSSESSDALRAAIWAIESDQSLTAPQKAKRRQQLMSGANGGLSDAQYQNPQEESKNDVHGIIDGSLNCSFCMQLLDRPVTTPCGHNFCLKCFQRWIGQGKRTCANCRNDIPPKMASQPRINSALVIAIRMAKMSKSAPAGGLPKAYHFVHNQDRPEKAYTTERAKKSGKANACSGKIFVTVPPDHFGPILAENDPDRKQGVLVGESWEDRLECRQWGAHLPMISGIAGQSAHGAQSVALSGGYQDDEDHGEWFLYTGSGGRDLSGNKRTNKEQSSDQEFVKYNEALRVSCRKGYPVRVVRSHKEKRSSYAPETGLRYDGIYRIEKCWFKVGVQGFKICRYLFVRCDNHPAPWTSDEHGDRPRPLPVIDELKNATNITERKADPSWDYDEMKDCWMWKKNPPQSKKRMSSEKEKNGKRTKSEGQARSMSVKDKLLKEFSCLICRKVMVLPLTTPCAHNFCKCCLEGVFAGQSFVRQRTCEGRRTLRTQKNVMKCPSCSNDISDFLKNPQVNRELMGVIESLQRKAEEAEDNQEASSAEESNIVEKLSAEEGNSMEEKPGTSESLVEETKEVPNHPETKTQQTRKRKKKTSDCKPELGRKRSRASASQEKTNVVNDDMEVSSVEREVSKKK